MRKFFYITLLLIITVACGERTTIPERKLVKILAEMHLADAAIDENGDTWVNHRRDSTAVYTAILDEYGYSTAQFYSSLQVYMRSKDDADKLYDKVCKRLGKLQKQYAKEVEALHKEQNRWTQESDWKFPNDGDTSRLAFSIPVDSASTYILSADITLQVTDSVNNPRITMYLCAHRCHRDSVLVGTAKVDSMLCADSVFGQIEYPVVRDGNEQKCTVTITNHGNIATHVQGYILNHNNDSLGVKPRHAIVKNIMLRQVHVQTNVATEASKKIVEKFDKRNDRFFKKEFKVSQD